MANCMRYQVQEYSSLVQCSALQAHWGCSPTFHYWDSYLNHSFYQAGFGSPSWEEASYPHFVESEAVVPPLEIKEAALMNCESSFHLEEQHIFVQVLTRAMIHTHTNLLIKQLFGDNTLFSSEQVSLFFAVQVNRIFQVFSSVSFFCLTTLCLSHFFSFTFYYKMSGRAKPHLHHLAQK